MPIRSGLIVVLRLFAILILFQIAGYLLSVAAIAGQSEISHLPHIAIASLLLIPFMLVFWGSAAIVDFLAPKPTETLPEGRITASELQAIAFTTMGAFILYLTVTRSVGMLAAWHFVTQMPGAPPFPVEEVPQNLLGWVVGLFLLLGGPGLRQWIMGLRRAGPKLD